MSTRITEMKRDTWLVRRTAILEEVEMDNGAVRFRVHVSDENRPPFISRWFNDPVPASDFIERMQGGHFDPQRG